MNKPKISVIMPSYNHRDYVGEAIKTVLAQDFQDFEFLIADDCSKDDSVEVIKKYEDPRIKHFFLKQNVGPTQILKMLIENAQGEYIALINSDDLWHKDKLSKQIQVLENDKNLAACFTWADFVDENGKIISENSNENVNIFIEKNKTRSQWLNWFFHNGNCLCHPSVLIRKSVYSDIGFYNDMYRQLPDFEYWVRLTLKYSFYIIEEVLTDHRRTTGENTNTSANTRVNNLRLMNEGVSIAKKMLMEADENLLIEAFKDEFVISGAKSKEELVIERYFLLRDNKMFGDALKNVAGRYLMQNADEAVIKCMTEKYAYSVRDFFADSIFSIDGIQFLEKEISIEAMAFYTNDNFTAEKSIKLNTSIEKDTLKISFVLPEDACIVRIDPVENHGIAVADVKLTVDGVKTSITAANGKQINNVQYFNDLDPQYVANGDFKKGSKFECEFTCLYVLDYNMYSLNEAGFKRMDFMKVGEHLLKEKQAETSEIEKLNQRIAILEQEKTQIITEYENSLSWKITGPLRKIKSILKK